MSEFSIRYKIEDEGKNREEVKDRHMIGGGICVKYNDLVLAGPVNENRNEKWAGYLGNWIFDDILVGFINSVYLLIGGATNSYEIPEDSIGFYMEGRNDHIFISIAPFELDEEDIEEFIAIFPVGSKGFLVPAKLYYNEVIRVGHEFLNDILKRYKNFDRETIETYNGILKHAEELVDEYNKTH